MLRLAIGMALAMLIAYGLALSSPFVVCVVALLLLCGSGRRFPSSRALVVAGVVGSRAGRGRADGAAARELRLAGVMVTAVLLYAAVLQGRARLRHDQSVSLTTIRVVAFTRSRSLGVADQALVTSASSTAFAVGLAIGMFVNGISHALFPDPPAPDRREAAPAFSAGRRRGGWHCRPRWSSCPCSLVALTNPCLLSGRDHEDRGARPAGRRDQARARPGTILVGSTLIGAAMALASLDRPVDVAESSGC